MKLANPCLLAIDLGTTGCKALAFSTDGRTLAQGSWEIPTSYPRPGWAEQSALDWWTAAQRAVSACVGQLPPDVEVLAIGLSSQRETVVPVDADGVPLANAILWMDRRSTGQARDLVRLFGAAALSSRTGLIPDATFTATKLLWWHENDPALSQRAAKWLQPRDFIAHRLTGRFILDPSLAGRTMLYDLREGTFISDIVQAVGLRDDQLPEIVPSCSVVGGLTASAANALGLKPGIPVAAGGGDRPCEALGLGVGEGRVMESTGTTTNVTAVVTELPDLEAPVALLSCHLLSGRWLVEQGMTTSGTIMRWFRDELVGGIAPGEAGYGRLDEEARTVPPGASGAVLLPFFMGARATRWNPDASGALLGLTLHHGRGHVARAVMEGIAMEIRACLDVLANSFSTPAEEVWLTGGAAKAALWRHIKADVLGRALFVPQQTEGASVGAALAAGAAIGLFEDPVAAARLWNPAAVTVPFDAAVGERYDSLYRIYNDAYEAMRPVMRELQAFKEKWSS